MKTKLEELKDIYVKAEKEYNEVYKQFTLKASARKNALTDYERELYKNNNCSTCKYSVITDVDYIGEHNICGCKDAPCTCCNARCEHYQPDTPLTKAIKENINGCIDLETYKGLKLFYGDILTSPGSINPKDDKEYNPIAKKLYDILKMRYGEKINNGNIY